MAKKLRSKTVSIKEPKTGFKKNVTVKTFELPSGLVETYFIDNDKDSVEICALTKEKQILVVKQFRPGTETIETELPGGSLEPNEDKTKAALRELREETGYTTDNMIHLASVNYSPYSSGQRHKFFARDCYRISKDLDLDPNENLTVKSMSLEEIGNLVKHGRLRGYDTVYLALGSL